MFDHVVIGVRDHAVSRAFHLQALKPLGIAVASEGEPGIELCRPGEQSSLCIRRQPIERPSALHLAFIAGSRAQVDAFHRAALAAGGIDNGAPGLRSVHHADDYAAFVLDPDGHNVEAVCHARGE